MKNDTEKNSLLYRNFIKISPNLNNIFTFENLRKGINFPNSRKTI